MVTRRAPHRRQAVKEFGARVRAYRIAKHISQEALGTELGYSSKGAATIIHFLETGRMVWTVPMFLQAMKFMGYKIELPEIPE